MLEIIGSSLLGWLWQLLGNTPKQSIQLESIAWQDTAIFKVPDERVDPVVQQIIDDYLQSLSQRGINSDLQGVWLQSDWIDLGNYRGTQAVSAASLTKIATTLAVLEKLGIDYRFVTHVAHTGSIENGILQGDLIFRGNRDPLFVWEEAIAIANTLNKLGIEQIAGDLLVDREFYMNYETDPQVAGKLLKQALQPHLWSAEVKRQFASLPSQTPRPQLKIRGEVKVVAEHTASSQLLLSHQSLSLIEILRQMNIYSNNKMAQMLADIVGDASAVASYTVKATGVSPSEIQIINGSGLGEENRISPRAATEMLKAIDSLLQPHNLEVRDIFPVADRDNVGTMVNRALPSGVAVKTGTLDRVSALAGAIPLQDERKIWFAIVNSGWQIEQFRQEQDKLLQKLAHHWQLNPTLTQRSLPEKQVYLGDPQRNQIE